MTVTPEALLHDGTTIPITVTGTGPALLLPVRTEPHDPEQAETMRQWGADPELGPALIAGLSGSFRVIAADYEGHRMSHPAPDTLTPDTVTADLLAIADAAGASSFAYYGYSWLALSGLQLAIRTPRLSALAMGGYPPIDGPYAEMLAVTRAAHGMATAPRDAAPTTAEPGDWDAVSVQTDGGQTRQFVTLYQALQGFDDARAQARLRIPRLCFAGADDRIDYGQDWGDVQVRIADPLTEHRAELEREGWSVLLLPDLDHMGAMHSAVVLPILVPWLRGALS
jgi:pimeloyl-ACP methyl ester carboxylesterase